MTTVFMGQGGYAPTPPQQQDALDPTRLAALMMQVRQMKMGEAQNERANAQQSLDMILKLADKGMMSPEMATAAEKNMKKLGIDVGAVDKSMGTSNIDFSQLKDVGVAMGGSQQGAQAATPVKERSNMPEGGGVSAKTPANFADSLMQHSKGIQESNLYKSMTEKQRSELDLMRGDQEKILLDKNSTQEQRDEASYKLGSLAASTDPSKFNIQAEAFYRANPNTKTRILNAEADKMSWTEIDRISLEQGTQGAKSGMFSSPGEGAQYFKDIATKGKSDITPKASIESIVNTAQLAVLLGQLNIDAPPERLIKAAEGGATVGQALSMLGQGGKTLTQASLKMQQDQLAEDRLQHKAEREHWASQDLADEQRARAARLAAEKELRETNFKEQELALKDNEGLRNTIEALGKLKNPPSKALMKSLQDQLVARYGWREETVKNWLGSITGSSLLGLGESKGYGFVAPGKETGAVDEADVQNLVNTFAGKKQEAPPADTKDKDKGKSTSIGSYLESINKFMNEDVKNLLFSPMNNKP